MTTLRPPPEQEDGLVAIGGGASFVEAELLGDPDRRRIALVDDRYHFGPVVRGLDPVERGQARLGGIAPSAGLGGEQPTHFRHVLDIGSDVALEVGEAELADHDPVAAPRDRPIAPAADAQATGTA